MYKQRTIYPRAKPLYRSAQLIWSLVSIVEIILLFRFALRLIGASTEAAFTAFVYQLASPFVAPFLRIVPSPTLGVGVIDWNTLIAMLVYYIIGILIVRFLAMSRPVSSIEAQYRLVREE